MRKFFEGTSTPSVLIGGTLELPHHPLGEKHKIYTQNYVSGIKMETSSSCFHFYTDPIRINFYF